MALGGLQPDTVVACEGDSFPLCDAMQEGGVPKLLAVAGLVEPGPHGLGESTGQLATLVVREMLGHRLDDGVHRQLGFREGKRRQLRHECDEAVVATKRLVGERGLRVDRHFSLLGRAVTDSR